jgi:hypothetical protein
LRAVARAGKLEINLYGDTGFKQLIELSHVVDSVIDYQETREIDPEMPTGEERIDHEGFPGYVVRSFRTFLDESGQILKQEQLARDYYKPLNKLVYTGPLETEQPEGAAENEAGNEPGVHSEEKTGPEMETEDLPLETTDPSGLIPSEAEHNNGTAETETSTGSAQENKDTNDNGKDQETNGRQ